LLGPDVPSSARSRLEVCVGTLERIDQWAEQLNGCDTVVHVAAEMRGATAVLFAGNVIGTRRLLDAAIQAGVRRFVVVSSMGIFGTGTLRPGDVLDERCPVDPNPHLRDPYSYSKIAQEAVVWDAHKSGRIPVVVIRPGVIYGPSRDVLSGRVGLRLGPVLLRMGGRQPLPYTYVDNCADALALAVTSPGVEGEAFNIVDDDIVTGQDMVRRYRANVGRLLVIPVPAWAISPLAGMCEWYHRWSSGQLPAVLTRYKSAAMWKAVRYINAKAKARLGWRPAVGLDEGLRRTFAAMGNVGPSHERMSGPARIVPSARESRSDATAVRILNPVVKPVAVGAAD
jgi:nucleoside-diphosphate-sugar epimerase